MRGLFGDLSILWLSRRHCVASPKRSLEVLLLERGRWMLISQLSNSNNEVGIAIGHRIARLLYGCCLCVGAVLF